MKRLFSCTAIKAVALGISLCASAICVSAQNLWDINHLQQVKEQAERPFYAMALQALLADADSLMTVEPYSVTTKKEAPASSDIHDYMSLARYFWPNPDTADGLPYVNRDGISNPELKEYDREKLGAMADMVTTLSLAWYFTGDERYASKAAEQIRVWFINGKTRMNPNLNYAQVVRGQNGNKGRSYGVLDSYSFVEMLDAVALLEKSRSFRNADSKALKKWFGQFLEWILESPQGKEEAQALNNHSVAYDVQAVAFAMYAGELKTARRIVEEFPGRRVFRQVDADGKQPHELSRTLAYGYSQYNLSHMTDMYVMGRKLGMDYAAEPGPDGTSYYKAMDFLASYTGKPQSEWPYQQISGWEEKNQEFCKDLYRCATMLGTPSEGSDYMGIYNSVRRLDLSDRFNLLYYTASHRDDAMAVAINQVETLFSDVEQLRKSPANMAKGSIAPRSINADGSIHIVSAEDWCCGFYPGMLWMIYEYSNDPKWRQRAVSATWRVEDAKWRNSTHDLGFMINDCFGHALRITGEQSYRDVVLQAAQTLITRFNPAVGCIRSWDFNREQWDFPVIIDNMMNLEMLFQASILSGDDRYRKIAMSHADVTMANHFRADNSSYHVVDYNPQTGDVRLKCTRQGIADDSVWSRGQAWGLYGYTMCYRYTGEQRYLDMAHRIAAFILGQDKMPQDLIPYWDMCDPRIDVADGESAPRDASSAAIMASALYQLCSLDAQNDECQRYMASADKIMESLYKSYLLRGGDRHGFLLDHSTGDHPRGGEIDTPIIYGDYYYLEALSYFSAVSSEKKRQ